MNSRATVGAIEIGGEHQALLIEWRRLSEREGAAIARNDWKDLAEQQAAKTQLREQISARMKPATPCGTYVEKTSGVLARRLGVEALLAEILILEARNRDTLQVRRRDQRKKLDSTAQTLHRLQELRRVYANGVSARWQSYS
jgi:hypothetical protein